MPSPVLQARGRRNALYRHHGADHPKVLEADRDLRAVRLAGQIRAAVDAAPPLTDEQIAGLRQLLTPAGDA